MLVHLQGAEHREVDVAAADHRERLGAAEVAAAGQFGDRLLAGIDEVRIDIRVERIRARRPSMPFSECRVMCTPGGTKFATSVGMPMPRFT